MAGKSGRAFTYNGELMSEAAEKLNNTNAKSKCVRCFYLQPGENGGAGKDVYLGLHLIRRITEGV